MNRVVLRRLADGVVEAGERADDGAAGPVHRLPAGDLPGFVREREAAPVRWVWDDTTRWYPAMLRAGVRVERCSDLRLSAAILRRSPFADRSLLVSEDAEGWAALQPVTSADPALFPLDDPADRLDTLAEHDRQQAVLAASAERGRLGLLLAAESSGALVAAEMGAAGLPWRTDVHERLLVEALGPRPVGGRRPAVLESLLAEVRVALRAPELNADSPAALLRALQLAGLPVEDTRSWSTASSPACTRPTAGRGCRPGPGTGASGRTSSRAAWSPGGGRPAAEERCRCRPRYARPRWPTTGGGSSSPTSPSSSPGCWPA